MRHECSNCKFFMCEVVRGDGKPLEPIGNCTRPVSPKFRVEADDWCNQYQIAKWAKEVV